MLGLVTNSLSVGGFKNLQSRENIALEYAAYITFLKLPKVEIHAAEKIAWTPDGEYGYI